jgi:hypothetical protein
MGLLQELASRLTIPGLPAWTGLLALLVLLLVALAYLLMPFSVFGLKGRLESLEAQLDEVHAEIRSLGMRLTEGASPRRVASEEWLDPPDIHRAPAEERPAPRVSPHIPPTPSWPETPRGGGGGRSEPRLDWPGRRQ